MCAFFLLVSLSMRCETIEMKSRDIDSVLFNCSMKSLVYAAKLAGRVILRSPKMIALLLSLYFYKDILRFIQGGIGYVVGEYPVTCVAILCALWVVLLYMQTSGKSGAAPTTA
jgi:hypothetical protein